MIPTHSSTAAELSTAQALRFAMNYTVAPIAFEAGWAFTLSRTFALCIAMLLYGILLVLLSIAVYLLYNWNGAGRSSLVVASAAMALLGTAQIVLELCAAVLGLRLARIEMTGEVWLPKAVATYGNIYTAKDALLVTNNMVTDSLFIYRCFIVWGGNLRAAALPMLMLLGTTVTGFLTVYRDTTVFGDTDFWVPYTMGIATNVVLMGLTAGRIWWIRRDASVILAATHVRKYNTTIAIILESGAIYCLSIIIFLICSSMRAPIPSIFEASLPQMMNIAPMLVIVRVGLSRATSTEHGQQALPGVRRSAVVPDALTREVRANASSVVIDIGAVHDVIPMADLEKDVQQI
ncbi:hypothetical protein DFH06DRAFT_1214836 [Mycena polygramma]|nr:hypothetical protein DFH06DRAFT_1214836 [Mycena polygramma]